MGCFHVSILPPKEIWKEWLGQDCLKFQRIRPQYHSTKGKNILQGSDVFICWIRTALWTALLWLQCELFESTALYLNYMEWSTILSFKIINVFFSSGFFSENNIPFTSPIMTSVKTNFNWVSISNQINQLPLWLQLLFRAFFLSPGLSLNQLVFFCKCHGL